jgi:hypothetical protein
MADKPPVLRVKTPTDIGSHKAGEGGNLMRNEAKNSTLSWTTGLERL